LVRARAPRNQVSGWSGDSLRVAVTAPPEGGKANAAVCSLLAGIVGVGRSQVTVVSGAGSHRKLLRFEGVSPDGLKQVLGRIIPGASHNSL